MSTNNTTNSPFSLKSILEKDKLDNTNFVNWYRNLKIVLRAESKMYILEEPIPDEPEQQSGPVRRNWEKHVDDSLKVTCLMLACMSPELQQTLENLSAFDIKE